MTQRNKRGSYVFERGGPSGLQHRPTAREAPKGPADQPRTKVLGCGNRGELHWSDPQPIPKPTRQGVRFNDYIAVAGSETPG